MLTNVKLSVIMLHIIEKAVRSLQKKALVLTEEVKLSGDANASKTAGG